MLLGENRRTSRDVLPVTDSLVRFETRLVRHNFLKYVLRTSSHHLKRPSFRGVKDRVFVTNNLPETEDRWTKSKGSPFIFTYILKDDGVVGVGGFRWVPKVKDGV